MASRSGSRRRITREKTSQTVDFLNNLNTNRTSNSSPAKPTHTPRRRPSSRRQIPNSDDIWEDAQSPEGRPTMFGRIPQSEPLLTPRRSGRLRSNLASELTPTRGPARQPDVRNADSKESGEKDDYESMQDSDYESAASNQMDEVIQKNRQGSDGGNDLAPVQFFSDEDDDNLHHSVQVEIPSPSVVVNKQPSLQHEEVSQEDDVDMDLEHESGSESDSEYGDKPQSSTPERVADQSRPRATSTPTRKAKRSSLTAQISQSAGLKSREAVEIPTAYLSEEPADIQPEVISSQAEESSVLEHDVNNGELAKEMDKEPSSPPYVPEESDESSDESLPASESIEHSPGVSREDAFSATPSPKKGSSRTNHTRSPQNGAQQKEKSSPREAAQIASSNREASVPPSHEDKVENRAKTEKHAWFKEAGHLGGQKNNWNILISEAMKFDLHEDELMTESLKDLSGLTSELLKKYATINQDLNSHCRPSSRLSQECQTHLDSLKKKGDKVIDTIYNLAVKKSESDWEEGKDDLLDSENLMKEFEACITYPMVKIILTCFNSYYHGNHFFRRAEDHLEQAMSLLLRFYDRLFSLNREKYVRCTPKTQGLRRPLKQLINALKDGLLKNKRLRPTSGGGHVDGGDIIEVRHGFTDDEGEALLEGLQRYQGSDRYHQIKENFSLQLDRRTESELRNEAWKFYGRYLPMIQDQIQTPEGRRRWHWLLSVKMMG